MKYFKITYLALLVVVFIISNCGQGGDINPTGVTGGSDEGYGSRTDISDTKGDGDGDGNYQELIGSWRSDYDTNSYYIWVFNSDGTFEYYDIWQGELWEYHSGTYSVSGNTISVTGDGYSFDITFYVSGNELTLDGEVFYRF